MKIQGLLLGLLMIISCGTDKVKNQEDKKENKEIKQSTNTTEMQDGIYAEFNTAKGQILVELHYDKAPITVANFVGLSEGSIKNDKKSEGEPYYDGLTFHRVISEKNGDQQDFMVQGGCPNGNGMGGPGYEFDDEIVAELKHEPFVLSMANAGPGTNGSQFFITLVETGWLDGKHTVFGKVIEGKENVGEILTGDTIESVKIIRKGSEAESFDAPKVFASAEDIKKEKQAKAKEEMAKEIEKYTEGFDQTESGLYYKITKKTDGKSPEKGKPVSVHYRGKLTNGKVFDSSFERKEPIEFPIGQGMVIPGWDEGIALLKEGEEATLVIPSHLGYGSRGAGGVIPPNAILIFDVELVKAK